MLFCFDQDLSDQLFNKIKTFKWLFLALWKYWYTRHRAGS